MSEINETGQIWDRPGIPHRGWQLQGVYDLGPDASGICEMCGQTDIRYIHTVAHPQCTDDLDVGCVCAEKMTEDYINPRKSERELRNRATRRSKWLTRRWRVIDTNFHYLHVDGHIVSAFPMPAGAQRIWWWAFDDMPCSGGYHSVDEAKLAAFDSMNPSRKLA